MLFIFKKNVFIICLCFVYSPILLANSHYLKKNILIVVSSKTTLYQQTIQSFEKNLLGNKNNQVTQLKYTRFNQKSLNNMDIVIALGKKASLKVAQFDKKIPTIYALIPKVTLDKIKNCCQLSSKEAAIFLDQPLLRQFNLLYEMFGSEPITGLLFSDKTDQEQQKILDIASQAKIQLNIVLVSKGKPIGYIIREKLKNSQALLAIPDPLIYNRENIYSIFLTTYSMRIPVIGYSNAMTKAGAILSLYSSPKDIGKQLADWFNSHDKDQHYREAPHYFHISVNGSVARSLDIDLPKKELILKKLKKNEQT